MGVPEEEVEQLRLLQHLHNIMIHSGIDLRHLLNFDV